MEYLKILQSDLELMQAYHWDDNIDLWPATTKATGDALILELSLERRSYTKPVTAKSELSLKCKYPGVIGVRPHFGGVIGYIEDDADKRAENRPQPGEDNDSTAASKSAA